MFSDTWVSLTATQETVDAASYLGRYLVSAPSDYLADIHGEVHGAAAAALPGLILDPQNAYRLNNAAVALFDLGLSFNQAFEAIPELRGGAVLPIPAGPPEPESGL